MYLVFIDESGNPRSPKTEQTSPQRGTTLYLTFAAVIMDMAAMHDVESRLKDFKNEHLLSRRTEAKYSISVEKLKPGITRDEYRREYAELINASDITVISVVVNKFKANFLESSKLGMYRMGFQELLSLLREFQVSKDFAQLAFVVDSVNDDHDGMVAAAYDEALRSFEGSPGFFISQYSPSIVFGKSTHSPGLQIVDFCAAAIQRSAEASDGYHAGIFKPRIFTKSERQYGYGFKWVPAK